jgi:hypothetical protein
VVDFSIDADFQEKLDWMDEFVRTRVRALADGVTELHLTSVARAVLRKYTPAAGNFPTEVLFERKAWAAEQLQPILDEVGVTFAESRGTVDVVPHPQP